MKAVPKEPSDRKSTTRPTVSAILADGSLVEMVHDPEARTTALCVYKAGNVRIESSVANGAERLVPYSVDNNLLVHEVVLLPSAPVDCGTEEELVAEIRRFIHTYVDVSPLFETIASYYVLFSWVYDSFNELPYLRVRGDTGSGKTRCLLTIGSLCYKPIFASGASTVSPIFRILDSFRGTLIVDEGDFRFSDERADIIKILNNGNARGFPVLRSESVNNGKEFDPRAYAVFGPKFIATRNYFEDRALESRCITEETGGRVLRKDVPLNLNLAWKDEARALRNKLLMFRFRNYGHHRVDIRFTDRSIEPRLAQVFGPLLSVVSDADTRQMLLDVAREYHRELVADRGTDIEAQVLETIRELLGRCERVVIKEIADRVAAKHGDDYERRITAKWIGGVVRRSLQLKTQRSNGVFLLAPGQRKHLCRLYEKYGIANPDADALQELAELAGDFGDIGDVPATLGRAL